MVIKQININFSPRCKQAGSASTATFRCRWKILVVFLSFFRVFIFFASFAWKVARAFLGKVVTPETLESQKKKHTHTHTENLKPPFVFLRLINYSLYSAWYRKCAGRLNCFPALPPWRSGISFCGPRVGEGERERERGRACGNCAGLYRNELFIVASSFARFSFSALC